MLPLQKSGLDNATGGRWCCKRVNKFGCVAYEWVDDAGSNGSGW
jgi:hypothetical protein